MTNKPLTSLQENAEEHIHAPYGFCLGTYKDIHFNMTPNGLRTYREVADEEVLAIKRFIAAERELNKKHLKAGHKKADVKMARLWSAVDA